MKSLLKGFDHYENLSDMRRRLEELPTDLKKLYQYMLNRLEPAHQREGSKFLQIVLRSQEVQFDMPLDLQQLSFAIEDTLAPPEPSLASRQVYDSRWFHIFEGRLRS